tara:strand:- start:113 stop:337 length:225 start_codon:yes stop_codon:yes gene_type:complete
MSTSKRYNLAYNYILEDKSKFIKNIIINGSSGRADDDVIRNFSKEVCHLAESSEDIPIVKSNYKEELVPSGSNE